MRSVEQIEDLRGSWQSPQLRAIPADFIGEMENYCKEAPRPFDDAKKVSSLVCVCVCDNCLLLQALLVMSLPG